ncbi:Asp23/Gls24 family envelope stress response protein [Convivina intestini]|uniref:Asp23/Gls24 family envelope stress response protein n=1 Tax=Convivina intestini TaxID=1505726 RepID=UPI002010B166|nr:Asp23/Gls24 family envelope stress response protein [Convivina intestini]CAH1850522.1 hypothetical protein R078131_00107 [Convivina intestini]
MTVNKNFVLATSSSVAGQTMITPEVLEIIAQKATQDVEGVFSMRGNLTDRVVRAFGSSARGKGVQLTKTDQGLEISTYVFLKYGVTVPQVALNIQRAVMTQVASMTGLVVNQVNVHISGIIPNRHEHGIDPDHMFDQAEDGE